MEYFLKGEHKRLWETVGTKLQAWCVAWLEKNMLTRFSDYQASLCLDQLKRKILKERIRELQEYAFEYPYESSFACDRLNTRRKPLALAMGTAASAINQHIEKSVCRARLAKKT